MEPTRPTDSRSSGLVGRDVELEALAGLLAGDRPVAVVGEAGIGKTTLVRAAAERSGLRLREGGALATLAWTPLLALRRAVGDGLAGDLTSVATEVERRIGPDLLFVDDIQWADGETRDVLAVLAGRIAIVAAIRAGDPGAETARELVREAGGEIVELAGLDPDASAEVVRRAQPTTGPDMVARLVEQAGGNPLLLEELATRGRPTTTLSRALASRLDDLSPAARRSFAALALAGRPVARRGLGRAAGELLRSRIVVESEGMLAVRHSLFAEAAVASLSDAERRQLHARLADMLGEPGERARHLAAAGRPAEAALAAQTAADAADSRTERASHLELVARMTEGPAGDLARLVAGRLLVEIAGSASSHAIELLEGIEAAADEVMVERDALLVHAHWETGDLEAARAAGVRGRQRRVPPTSPALALLDVEEALLAANGEGDMAKVARILDAAEAAGRGTPRITGLRAVMEAYADGKDTLDQLRTAYDAAASDAAGSEALTAIAQNLFYVALAMRGFVEARTALHEAADLLRSRGMPARVDELLADDVEALVLAGRPAEAALLAAELLERPLPLRTRQIAMIVGALASAWQGHADVARHALDTIAASVTDDWQGHGELAAVRAEVQLLCGRPTAVEAAFQAHLQVPSPSEVNRVIPTLAAKWAAFELGREIGPPIEPLPWRTVAGGAPESEGIAGLVAGDFGLAERRFRAAAVAWEGFHAPRELWCRWAQGEALRLAGAQQAKEVLEAVVARADAMGLEPVALRARRSLRQAGFYSRQERSSARDPSARMTRRERETLQLVGRGLATPEIARRMGLGRGTVDQIIGAAMRKLGAVSRVQAAAILERGSGERGAASTTVVVRDEDQARSAVLAAMEGARVAIDPAADPELAARLQDDLRHLGQDDVGHAPLAPGPELGSEAQQLLARIAEGMSLGEAANSLNISRRTADRRLMAARRAFGVASTAEALVAFHRRGSNRPD